MYVLLLLKPSLGLEDKLGDGIQWASSSSTILSLSLHRILSLTQIFCKLNNYSRASVGPVELKTNLGK